MNPERMTTKTKQLFIFMDPANISKTTKKLYMFEDQARICKTSNKHVIGFGEPDRGLKEPRWGKWGGARTGGST